MRSILQVLILDLFLGFAFLGAMAQTPCPDRPGAGSTVTDPLELRSENGVLTVDLTMLNSVNQDGIVHYCYVYADGSEAPTLLVNPGDRLVFNLTNRLAPTARAMTHLASGPASADGCAGGMMTSASSNVHFHGLNIPPKCHQDETIKTLIQPNDPPFQYSFQIPENDPPGLYWYHPHPHQLTTTQVLGGATGALIVGGVERMRPEVAGLPERVFVVRQFTVAPPPQPMHKKSSGPDDGDDSAPLSLNFVPIFEKVLPPVIVIKPGEKQLWRVLNATSIFFLALQLQVNLDPQKLELVAVDGIPLDATRRQDTIIIPPAGRAEFIAQGPAADASARLVNLGFDTGPQGDYNPFRTLASISANADAPAPAVRLPAFTRKMELKRFVGLGSQRPTAKRKLYFSEISSTLGTTQFFITVDGQTPKLYDPDDPPAIVTRQGAVEDWTIENRSGEVHAFHIHQLHFLVLAKNGKPVNDPTIRDTVVIPYWDGKNPRYPSVKIRLDFRDPNIVGTFLYHCHILDHEDGGMMAKIKVKPAK
jgi:FtsP/CotA-like multicopper oxidase with cupredoxin domain